MPGRRSVGQIKFGVVAGKVVFGACWNYKSKDSADAECRLH